MALTKEKPALQKTSIPRGIARLKKPGAVLQWEPLSGGMNSFEISVSCVETGCFLVRPWNMSKHVWQVCCSTVDPADQTPERHRLLTCASKASRRHKPPRRAPPAEHSCGFNR